MKSSQDSRHTAHPFHNGAQHQAGARLKHQDFTTSVDVCQRQDLGERVVPEVATSHRNKSYLKSLSLVKKNTILKKKTQQNLFKQVADSPDLPRLTTMIHHCQDATGRF